jgi:hypothetical protein
MPVSILPFRIGCLGCSQKAITIDEPYISSVYMISQSSGSKDPAPDAFKSDTDQLPLKIPLENGSAPCRVKPKRTNQFGRVVYFPYIQQL